MNWTKNTNAGWTWHTTDPIALTEVSKQPVTLRVMNFGDFYECTVRLNKERTILTWTTRKSLECAKSLLESNIEYALDHILRFYK